MTIKKLKIFQLLILLKVTIFFFQIYYPIDILSSFALWPNFSSADYPNFKIWQPISFAFLHGNILHLAFNCLAIYIFGSLIEKTLGARKFLKYYIFCTGISSLLHLLTIKILNFPTFPVIGASGGVFGILAAIAFFYPNKIIMLIIPPIPIKAKYFIIIYGIIELYFGLSGGGHNIAHFAHLGGLIGGYLILRLNLLNSNKL